MKVHFICTGNTYRSRVAEAYLNSKKLNNISSYSSGIEADKALSGPITWWASRLLFNAELIEFMSYSWQKTTKRLLDQAEITIFMEQVHFDFCSNELGFKDSNYEIWNIADVNPLKKFGDKEKIETTELAFQKIKEKVDNLAEKLEKI